MAGGELARSYGGAVALLPDELPLWAFDLTWASAAELALARRRFRSAVPHRRAAVLDQGPHPVCTGAAAALLLSLAEARAGLPVREYAPAWLYLLGAELTAAEGGVDVAAQVLDGVPLPATLQATVAKGALTRQQVRNPTDPVALRRELLGGAAGGVSLASAALPRHYRVLKLNPTAHNVLLSLEAGYAVAFALRVDTELHDWFQDRQRQEATGFLAPEGALTLPRVATHACVVVDYDAARAAFVCLNSFGPAWGDGGRFLVRERSLLHAQVSDGDVYILA
jgi:hypothetical protein